MDVGSVMLLAVMVGLLLAMGYASGRGARLLGGLLGPPPQLGWPAGVQEDDDFTWRWTGTGLGSGGRRS